MKKWQTRLAHRFVDHIPERLEPGELYISIPYATAVHLCACGCGSEVVTPLSPTDWKMIFDGKSISLHPSIGNWSFPCQSHYWIRNNNVRRAPRWTASQIASGRAHSHKDTQRRAGSNPNPEPSHEREDTPDGGLRHRYRARWLKARLTRRRRDRWATQDPC